MAYGEFEWNKISKWHMTAEELANRYIGYFTNDIKENNTSSSTYIVFTERYGFSENTTSEEILASKALIADFTEFIAYMDDYVTSEESKGKVMTRMGNDFRNEVLVPARLLEWLQQEKEFKISDEAKQRMIDDLPRKMKKLAEDREREKKERLELFLKQKEEQQKKLEQMVKQIVKSDKYSFEEYEKKRKQEEAEEKASDEENARKVAELHAKMKRLEEEKAKTKKQSKKAITEPPDLYISPEELADKETVLSKEKATIIANAGLQGKEVPAKGTEEHYEEMKSDIDKIFEEMDASKEFDMLAEQLMNKPKPNKKG